MYDRKEAMLRYVAKHTHQLVEDNSFNKKFRQADRDYFKFLCEPDLNILVVGSRGGDLLNALQPKLGVGIDLSQTLVEYAQTKYPHLHFVSHDVEKPIGPRDLFLSEGQKFDMIIVVDQIGYFDDIQQALQNLMPLCHDQTRLIVSYYTKHWEMMVKVGEWLGVKTPQPEPNMLSTLDIEKLTELSGFEVIRKEYQQLVPIPLFGIDTFLNKFIGTLPGLRKLCLRTYVVARPRPCSERKHYSTTVVIPCRNEKGNIEPALQRLPQFCDDMEIIFVEGHSKDGTWEEVLRVKEKYQHLHIKAFQQEGKGKADAVHLGFRHATGDVLMILDADLTVPPEQLPKFYEVIATGQGDFVNGTRLIYPMESQAMRFLNFLANKTFSWLFSYLLSQRFTDTLCGTKVFLRSNYHRIIDQRKFFGDFDPFGDFELIFGASKLNMKVVEVPIRYKAREYGETQISRFRHGFILLKMVIYAYKKLKLRF